MVIYPHQKSKDSFIKNVSFMFVVYWGILVLWQNVSGAELRGTADLFIKIGLLIYFVGFYLLRARMLNSKVFYVLLLGMALLITATTETQFPLSNVIAYVYPILILLMVYGLGDGLQIKRTHLLAFCNCVICITVYAVVYAVLFCPEQFTDAVSAQYAYGNEMRSFFISSHEYGMYLVAAIICAILCLRLSSEMSALRKFFYIAVIVLLFVNLILTFSRTSLLGLGVFILIYCFFGAPKTKKWIVMALVLIALLVTIYPSLSEFFFKIVLKENDMAGRDNLFAYGIQYFKNGTIFEQIFGYGIYAPRAYFEIYLDHGSVHNGYLQVLLYYGLIGCGAMVIFLLSQIVTSIRFLRIDRFVGTLSLALVLSASAMMLTNTSIIFTSSIDSFFMTMFFILVPKYLRNSTRNQMFYS